MASSASPPNSPLDSIVKNPRRPLGFFANAAKRKQAFFQFIGATGILLLSMRSLGQKYRTQNLEDDIDALKQEQQGLENRITFIKQSLLAEASAESTGAFAARLRLLFGDDQI